MGRPKKNADEQPLNLEGDKLFNEQQKVAESGENTAHNEMMSSCKKKLSM